MNIAIKMVINIAKSERNVSELPVEYAMGSLEFKKIFVAQRAEEFPRKKSINGA